ncbi:MAG: LamG-like jellyroll fold domain-containing protein, partial [Elusimicrobiales bacterium]
PALGGEVVSMGDNYVLRVMSDGNVIFFFHSGSAYLKVLTTGVNVRDGRWHHLAGVKTAGQLQVFVDGAVKAAADAAGTVGYALGSDLYIGRHGNASTAYNFNGVIDEARIYGTALSAAEVQAVYAGGIDVSSPTVPGGLSGSAATRSSFTLGWTAATDNVGVSGYRLDVSLNSGFTSLVAGYDNLDLGNATSKSVSGLFAGTVYFVRLRAYDAAGNASPDSAVFSYSTAALPPLVGYWKFDEASGGTTADASGLGNTGTLNGVVARVSGVSGSAVSFAGTGASVSVPGTAALKPASALSVAAWVKTSSTPALGGEVVSMGDNYVLRVMSDGNVIFFFHSGSAYLKVLTTGVNVRDGRWHHLAGVKTAGQLQVFVDGAVKAAADAAGTVGYMLGSDLYIGRHGNGSTAYNFNGVIDEARIYGTALSAAEVHAIYAASPVTYVSSATFQGEAFEGRVSAFTVAFDATPLGSGIEGIIGLSDVLAADFARLAIAVRFSRQNVIDALGSSGYTAQSVIPYAANVGYHFRLVINPPAHVYSAYVTPRGAGELTIVAGSGFGAPQSSAGDPAQRGGGGRLAYWNIASQAGMFEFGNFTISAAPDADPAIPAAAVSRARVYPNPFYPGRGQGQVTFDGLPQGAKVKIYTLQGELVWEATAGAGGSVVWPGKNNSGGQAASGLYLAYVKSGKDEKVLKLSVVR